MVNLKIDGKDVQIRKGATILAAAEKVGIPIPTLCFLKKVSPTGACRICVVEIAGADKPMTACNTPAVEGMVVTTQSEKLSRMRRQIIELLLVNHPLDCPVCDAGGECDLQNVCYAFDVTRQPFAAEDVNPPVIDGWPLIQQVPNRCILCEKCVKVCHEVVGASSLFINGKGDRAFIDKHLERCEFCGNCVAVCPTGTMISKPFKFRARPWEMTLKDSVCTQCGSHCQISWNVRNGELLRVTSRDEVTVNDGNLCVGGFFGHGYVNHPQRLAAPLVRVSGQLMKASWDEALAAAAQGLRKAVDERGGDAVAGLATPRLGNEEAYLFQKLFREALGSNNLDSEARFGALRVQKVLTRRLGLQGASNPLDRIGKARAVLVFGGDPTAEAPAVDWQIQRALRHEDASLVVANLRRIKLSRPAHLSLAYRPGSEVALANALSRLILDKGLADQGYLQRYVANLDELRRHLSGLDLAALIAATGLPRPLLEEAAEHLGRAESVALVFGADVARSDDAEVQVDALVNLALICGALHGDCGGLFPIDARANTQGLLDMGVCPELLPGQQPYGVARESFNRAWHTHLPEGGRDALSILAGIEKGEIRALYLVGVNPLTSFPESGRWQKALAALDCLVVQDILPSELTRLAHVVLPGSAAAEKTGSVTALDNRISCLGQAFPPCGDAREDWEVLSALYRKVHKGFSAPAGDRLVAEIRELVPLYGEVCGHGDGECNACLKQAWRPDEKSLSYVPALSGEAAGGGLELLVGKSPVHFGVSTTFAAPCRELEEAATVAINPLDAARLGVGEGALVQLTSGVGTVRLQARLTEAVPAGLLFAAAQVAAGSPLAAMPSGRNRVAVQLTLV